MATLEDFQNQERIESAVGSRCTICGKDFKIGDKVEQIFSGKYELLHEYTDADFPKEYGIKAGKVDEYHIACKENELIHKRQ